MNIPPPLLPQPPWQSILPFPLPPFPLLHLPLHLLHLLLPSPSPLLLRQLRLSPRQTLPYGPAHEEAEAEEADEDPAEGGHVGEGGGGDVIGVVFGGGGGGGGGFGAGGEV